MLNLPGHGDERVLVSTNDPMRQSFCHARFGRLGSKSTRQGSRARKCHGSALVLPAPCRSCS